MIKGASKTRKHISGFFKGTNRNWGVCVCVLSIHLGQGLTVTGFIVAGKQTHGMEWTSRQELDHVSSCTFF